MHTARIATIATLTGVALAVPTTAFAMTPTAAPAAAAAAAAPAAAAPAAPTELYVAFPQPVAPQVGVDGTLPFLTWPATQNPNGFEGHGYRIYLDRAYTGPGTYTMTLQKVGPGFSADFPDGTVIVDANGVKRHPSNNNDKQVVTVLPAIAADPVPDPEPVVPVVPEQPAVPADAAPAQGQAVTDQGFTSEVLAADSTKPNSVPRAATGYDEGSSVLVPVALWITVAGAAIGTTALVGARRARA